jgi:uncharacterized cupredoxin-like copper-binding protein
MHRKGLVSGSLLVASVGLAAWGLVVAGAASGQVRAHASAKVTVVGVTIGKPSELGFKLSKFSNLPAGTFTFDVKNAGLGIHNFKLCTTPATSSAKNACVGKATALLKHGQTATLTVVLTKTGMYEYICAVPGHAAAGMKGLLGVGVKVSAPTSSVAASNSSTSSSSGTTSSSTSGTTSGGTTTAGGGTTTAGGGGGGGGAAAGGAVSECPPGMTIVQAAQTTTDHDDDDEGGPTDGDGCL